MISWKKSENVDKFNELSKLKCKFCGALVSHLGFNLDLIDEIEDEISIDNIHFVCGTEINFHCDEDTIEEGDIKRDEWCYEGEIHFFKKQLEITK